MAQNCNFNYVSGAKECPTSGSTLLDDTYPVASYVISISPYYSTRVSKKVPEEFILKMLKSYGFSQNAPNIVVPAHPRDFEELRLSLEKRIAESKGKIPASVLDKIVPVASDSFTWQQDYFESFFDQQTGRPVIRRLDKYSNNDAVKSANDLAGGLQGCGVNQGEPILSDHELFLSEGKSFGSGEMGGNIEGLPGGLCLVGDNLSPEVSKQFCGDEKNVVQIDVSWLSVGHVDEVVKVMPTNIPGIPKECNFTLAFASPKKAIELLSNPKSANHPLFSGDFLSDGATNEQLDEFRTSRSTNAVGRQFCKILNKYAVPSRSNSLPGREKKSSPAIKAYQFFRNTLIQTAYAGIGVNNDCKVETLTNGEFHKAMQEEEFKNYNDLVQKAMDESRQKITEKILERLPQCKKHLSVMEVPNLFYGMMAEDENGKKTLPKPGNGGSFMPNPTNSVVGKNEIIFSDPQNPLFRNFLTEELKKKNIGASFIDTWDYSHLGDGNLHCASHSIPYCNPVKGK